MLLRLILAATLSVFGLAAQSSGPGFVGWYNGNRQSAIPGLANYYVSAQSYSRICDDFVVPAGGWTVVGVFSRVTMPPVAIAEAVWEIRSGISAGSAGAVVAEGRGPASLTRRDPTGSGSYEFHLQVDGLRVPLTPGRYWLSVAPVTQPGSIYIAMTLGAGAVGDPRGNNGGALRGIPGPKFAAAQSTGSGGTSSDVSLGVLVSADSVAVGKGWEANITTLVREMEARHSLPFPGVSLADFRAAAASLAARSSGMTDIEVRTALQALVASIGDSHTRVIWPAPSPFRLLPLSFYWFDDGIYVTGASFQYTGRLGGTGVLGGKLLAIGSRSAEEATTRLAPLVAHENDQWLKYVTAADLLVNADFLQGIGITDRAGPVHIEVRDADGEIVIAEVEPLEPGRSALLYPAFQGAAPLSRQHLDKHYWTASLDDGATLYFQYNSCSEDPAQPWKEFRAELDRQLADEKVQRVILDMRNNSGGLTSLLNPWIEAIRSTRFNRADRLYVIVGRATFSAAMEASNLLRDGTAATFVGEPTGAKPRFLLRRGDFPLPFFDIRVSFSNGVEGASDPGPTLVPDLRTPVNFADYIQGVDLALDAILALPLPAPAVR